MRSFIIVPALPHPHSGKAAATGKPDIPVVLTDDRG
jgi:hypothetical protein